MEPEQTGVIYKISYFVDPHGQLMVRLQGRDTEKRKINRVVSGTVPYFYVTADMAAHAKMQPEVTDVLPGPPSTAGDPTVKVCVKYPFQVPEVRVRFPKTWEADLSFATRIRIDYRLNFVRLPAAEGPIHISKVVSLDDNPGVVPRVVYFDIETDDRHGYAEPEHPDKEVTAVSVYDSYRDKYGVIYNDRTVLVEEVLAKLPQKFTDKLTLYPVTSEFELLGMFGAMLRQVQPDVVDAYNGYTYDYLFVSGRAALYDVSQNEDLKLLVDSMSDDNRSHGSFALLDSMMIYKKQEEKTRELSLETVAQDLLGFGKVPRTDSVSELQHTDLATWLAYSLWDTHILRLISEKRDMVSYLFNIMFVANVEAQDCEYNSRIVDGTLFYETRNNARHEPEMCLPTKVRRDEEDTDARAAIVFEPEIALHQWVSVVDLAQTYPSIERTLNISPETLVPAPIPGQTYDVPGYGSFKKSPPGLIPRAVIRMMSLRGKAKREAKELPADSPDKKTKETYSMSLKYVVNCARKGTLVATQTGPKPIEEVTDKDSVYCYTEHGVTLAKTKGTVLSGVQQTYRLRTKLRDVHVTANHPFLVAVCPGKDKKHKHHLEWKPLSSLRPGDLIVISNKLPHEDKPFMLPNGKETTDDFCRFLGCFAGDGWVAHIYDKNRDRDRLTNRGGGKAIGNQYGLWPTGEKCVTEHYDVSLALPEGTEERTKYVALAPSLFNYVPTCKNKDHIVMGKGDVGQLLISIGMDHPAPEKRFPDWVFELPESQMRVLIEGLVDSDGCVSLSKTGRPGAEIWAIGVTSKLLLDQIRFLCYSVGYRVGAVGGPNWSARVSEERRRAAGLPPLLNKQGFAIIQRHASYNIQIYPFNKVPVQPGAINKTCNTAVERTQTALPPGFELQAIRSIKPDEQPEATYDIEVEGHHNFIADGVVLHNSFTGVLKEKHWRFQGTTIVFESVTAVARMQLQWNRAHIEDPVWLTKVLGFPCVGRVTSGHTDSCYYKLYSNGTQITDFDILVASAHKITDALNASYPEFMRQFGVTGEQYTHVDLEGVMEYLRILPKAHSSTEGNKTQYFGTFAYKDDKDIRGLPFEARKKIMGVYYRRFNNARITKDAQYRVIEMVCSGKSPEVPAHYETLQDECVVQGLRDDDMLIPAKMGSTYAAGRTPPAWVTAMQNAAGIMGGQIRAGEVWKWCKCEWVEWKGQRYNVNLFAIPYRATLAEMSHKGLTVKMDRKAMFEKTVRDPMELVYPDLFNPAGGEEDY